MDTEARTINRWEDGRAQPLQLALKQIGDLLRAMGDDYRNPLETELGGEDSKE